MIAAIAPQKCVAAANDLEPEIDYARKNGDCSTLKLALGEFEQQLSQIPNAGRLHGVRCSLSQRRPRFDFNNMGKKAAGKKAKK